MEEKVWGIVDTRFKSPGNVHDLSKFKTKTERSCKNLNINSFAFRNNSYETSLACLFVFDITLPQLQAAPDGATDTSVWYKKRKDN